MTNTKNKIKSIILSIVAVVVIASMICVLAGVFENSQKAEVSADILIRANGVVEDGYVSPYASISGSIPISDEASLATFLSTSGTESSQVYGYLTKSFSTSRTMNGAIVDYHNLDGCGFEIELTDKTGVPNDAFVGHYNLGGTNGTFASEQNNLDNFFPFGANSSDAQSTTPFGYTTQKVSNVYPNQMGYFAGLLAYSEFQNLKIQYNGSFYDKDTSSDAGWSIGIIAGYAYVTDFNNMSLVVNGRVYGYFQQKYASAVAANPDGDIEGFGTICIGGYAGVIHKSNITNSYIEITKNNYISAISQGKKSGLYNRGFPRSFVGGMVGCNTNASKITNVTAAGQGTVYAWGLSPTKNDNVNRVGFSGIICGSNLSCSTPAYAPGHVGESNTKVSACANGTIDGVICSWTGVAAYYVGTYNKVQQPFALTTDDGSGKKAENHFIGGCIAGASSGDTIKNIYYTFDLSTLETTTSAMRDAIFVAQGGAANAAYDATRVSPVGISDTTPSPNYLKMGIVDDDGNIAPTAGVFNSSTLTFDNAQVGVFTLGFNGYDTTANIKIDFDVTKSDYYVDDAGMFTWNIHLYDASGSIAEVNRNYYEMASNMSDAITNYAKVSVTDVIPRGTTGLNVQLDGSFGYAVKYKLEGGGKTYDLGNKTYDTNTGVSTPTVYLYTLKNGVETKFNYPGNSTIPGSDSTISVGASRTSYVDSSIWTVYKQGSFTEYGFNIIKDAGTYELSVYNRATSGYDEKYDFMSESRRFVAYRVDNEYYDAEALKWMPYYTYTINKAPINAAWETITNSVDGTSYTSPVDFTYFGKNANFNYKYVSGLLGSDIGSSVMTYYKVKYVKVASNRLLNGTTYYAQNADGSYSLVGTRGDDWTEDPTLEYYYTKNFVEISNILDAGEYKIVISDFSNTNYTLDNSLVKEYSITVAPRVININFSNLNALEYTAYENKATYVVINSTGEVLNRTEGYGDELTASNANIVISNVYDATAIDFVYTAGNDYISVGRYSVSIALADGSVAGNYLLPNVSGISSTEGEVLEGENAVISIQNDEYGQVSKITRYIDIGYANVKMCREYSNGSYLNSKGVKYEKYDVIYSADPSLYPKKTITIDGVDKEVYFESETYKGYNGVPCIMMGVCTNLDRGVYEEIFGSFIYYPATLVDGKYVADTSTSSTSVVKKGIYVVKIEFNTDAYINYNAITEYMLYEVTGLQVTISMDTSALIDSVDYSATDLTKEYSTFATVTGLKIADVNLRDMGIKYKYYVEDDTYTEEDKLEFNSKIYRPVEKPQNAGNYIVVADNNINLDNYEIIMDSSCVNVIDTYKPYYLFTINKLNVQVQANPTSKVYGEVFDGTIGYTLLSTDSLIEGDDVYIQFTSLGAAEDANVGEYEIFSNCTGTSADNYNFVVDSSAKFTVEPKALTYNIGSFTKEYGAEFDTSVITARPTGNQIYVKDGIPDDVYPVYASDGFAATANVGTYVITATLEGEKKNNYTVTVNGAITLTKVRLTLNRVEANENLVYDGTEKSVKVYFDNTKNGDEPTAVVRYNYDDSIKPINVGKYYVIVMNVDDQNYTYTTTKEVSLEFEIVQRELKVNISSFTMGFGDTALTPTGTGFTYEEGSLEIVEGDDVQLSFETLDPETMRQDCGLYSSVVTAKLTGEDSDQYILTVVSNGDLTIEEKDISTMTLVKSSAEYTGGNLIDEIALNTTGTGCTFVVKNSLGEEVSEIIEIGEYTVTVTGGEGNYSAGSVDLTFAITKAHIASDYLTVKDLVINYNNVRVAGKATGETIQVSSDGVTFIDSDKLEFTITSNSSLRKEIYIKLLESDTHLESEVIRIAFTLTYDPNEINKVLDVLSNKLTFKDIETYKEMLENYEKVSEEDKAIVNATKKAKADENYEKLLKSASNAIVAAKTIAGKVTNRPYTLATTAASASLAGLLVVGLIALKKKKENL